MRKSGLLSALLLSFAACSGSDGTDPLVATTLTVSTSAPSIAVNATAQASAIVRDQNGNPLTGQNVQWASSNPAVASVEAGTGLIRGVSPGSATITGNVGTVTGAATITVTAPLQSCVGGPTVLDLAVGQLRVLSVAGSNGCVKIAATSGPSAYLVVAANANAFPDRLETHVLKSDTGEVVPNTTFLANPYRIASSIAARSVDPGSALQSAFESRIRRTERRELDIPAAQRAYGARLAGGGPRFSVNAAAIPAVGDLQVFKVPQSCSNFTTITARARFISARAILFTDTASPPGGFSDTEFQEIGEEFDNLIYPTDVEYFGTPLDLDANSRIIILFTPEVNKLTPSGSPGSFVGGFFFAGDFFPSSAPTGQFSCAQSNVAELFYLLSPDPDGTINGNKRTTADVRQGTRGTMAHEFQHMINASERIRSPIEQDFEDVWLDEALSHFAEDLNGRKLRGLTDESGNYTFEQLFVNPNDYNAFFFQNFARFRRYLLNPGPQAPTSEMADTSLAVRGAAWALLRYAADHYSPGGDIRLLMKALAGGPHTGVNNLATRTAVPFDTLIAGWMVANFADDFGISGLPAKYTYKTYNMRSNAARLNEPSRTYPLLVTEVTGTGFGMPGIEVRSASGNYFTFSRPAGGPARSFRFLNSDNATAASFTGAALYILRTQ